MNIGEASKASKVSAKMIRYYEQIGLIRKRPRSEGNRRQFDEADLDRLTFIRHARELGFDIDAIRALLVLQDRPGQPCADADAIARARLREVDQRIARLTALRAELQRMIDGCAHGRVDQCRVIEILGDHSLCLSEKH